MPPPTPRTIRMPVLERLFGDGLAVPGRVGVGDQAAPHFFHAQHRGLLVGGRQDAPLAALKLSRSLCRHDDEAVRAELRVVRDGVCGVRSWSALHCEIHSFLKQAWRLLFERRQYGPYLI